MEAAQMLVAARAHRCSSPGRGVLRRAPRIAQRIVVEVTATACERDDSERREDLQTLGAASVSTRALGAKPRPAALYSLVASGALTHTESRCKRRLPLVCRVAKGLEFNRSDAVVLASDMEREESYGARDGPGWPGRAGEGLGGPMMAREGLGGPMMARHPQLIA
ncbi:unnamed protein product [Lampetra planeri]